jgi:hypothetical protein
MTATRRLNEKSPMKPVSNSLLQNGLPPMAHVAAFSLFVGAVALMGGGSRSDIASLPALRGFAALTFFVMLAFVPSAAWRGIRIPLVLLGLLALWMLVQLIPLAPDIWRTLPLRHQVFAIDQLLGTPDQRRPISMTPALTMNSLLALIVPATALLVAAAVPVEERIRLWWAIWAFGIASAIFCLFQFMAGPRSGFYLYRITNEGSLVGLFANRNHNALLLSVSILSAGWLAANEISNRKKRPLVVPMLIASMVFFLLLILVIGSRFGLVFGSVSVLLAYLLVRWSYRFEPKPINQARGRAQGRGPAPDPVKRTRRILLNLLPFLLFVGLAALFYFSGRDNTIGRLVDGDGVEEIRVAALGTVASLAKAQWLLGSGFGSFAGVYQIVEPDALLRPDYFNHAHNDWLQLPIEGGLPAVAIFTVGVGWLVWSLITEMRRRLRPLGAEFVELVVLAGAFGLIALNSLVDYPLRTQSFAMVAAFLLVIMARLRLVAQDSASRG